MEEIKSYAFEYCRSITTITLWDSTAVSVLTLWTAPDAVSGEKLFLNCDSLNEIVLKNGSTTSSYYYSEEEPAEPGHYWHFVEGEVVFW